jgi:hypothetical protein
MLERDLQNFLFENPDVLFPNQTIRCKAKEVFIEGRRIDLLFEIDDIKYIIEIKRDTIRREDVGQVCEYYGLMRLSKPNAGFRMILVAPFIPEYRRLPLEEMGIRCIEVQGPPESEGERSKFRAVLDIQRKGERTAGLESVSSLNLSHLTFEDLLPPVSSRSMQISRNLLIDSLPAIEREYSQYEIRPVRMVKPNQPDVLCIPASDQRNEYRLVGAGAWWAYSFGHSEEMAKNDVPNISVNALPWGLDFAINAELRKSQQIIRERIAKAPKQFDRLVADHGGLRLQMWLKFEFQPRLYYWVLLPNSPGVSWTGQGLLDLYRKHETDFSMLRSHWTEWIKTHGKELTPAQTRHLENRNKNLNLAVRLVSTFGKHHALWDLRYREQVRQFDSEYRRLKPLIDFFQ